MEHKISSQFKLTLAWLHLLMHPGELYSSLIAW